METDNYIIYYNPIENCFFIMNKYKKVEYVIRNWQIVYNIFDSKLNVWNDRISGDIRIQDTYEVSTESYGYQYCMDIILNSKEKKTKNLPGAIMQNVFKVLVILMVASSALACETYIDIKDLPKSKVEVTITRCGKTDTFIVNQKDLEDSVDDIITILDRNENEQ